LFSMVGLQLHGIPEWAAPAGARPSRGSCPPPRANFQTSGYSTFINGAALQPFNHLFSHPNIKHRIGQVVQMIVPQLRSHVRIEDAPVVMAMTFCDATVWKILLVKETIQR
ncbi:hypothetical protein, partial [Sediminimonas qiaohouensis]|uniref:hypothetical protein n=1 Tax=Sediminimonas qiaohouensis TaxID=552061 RepID=UPI00235551B6